MFQPLNVTLAERIGVRSALVAQCLWDLSLERCPAETTTFDGRRWLRMSCKSLTVAMPYLTVNTAKREITRLKDLGIIRSRALNSGSFDHTRWFSFTESGAELMASTEAGFEEEE